MNAIRKNISILFLFLFLIAQTILGRTNNTGVSDSLLAKITSAQNDSIKIELYLSLIKSLVETSPEEADEYFRLVENLTAKDTLGAARIKLLNYRGIKFLSEGKYDSASAAFIHALRLSEEANEDTLTENVLNNLAILNIKTLSFEKGIEYFKRLYSMAIDEGNEEEAAQYLLNLSLAYAQSGQLRKAEENLLKLFNSTETTFYKAVAANSLSYIYIANGDFQKAAKYGKTAIDLARQAGNMILILEAETNYANALKMLNKYEAAQKLMFEILKETEKNNFREQYVNTLGNLATLFEAKGDFVNALKYQKMFSVAKDSLLNENIAKQLNELQTKYETEKKDKELALKDAALKRREMALRFTLFAIFFLVIFVVVVFVLYRKKREAYLELIKRYVASIETEKRSDEIKRISEETTVGEAEDKLSEEKVAKLYEILENKINDEKIFTQHDLTLGKLAAELNVSSKYLSMVIHKKYGETFPDFINKLRVKEAARMLLDTNYDNYSLEGIAEIAGFKSRSVFNSAFKKFTGVTPSFYKQSARQFVKENISA
jgi:AraC-like DNA-binding protein